MASIGKAKRKAKASNQRTRSAAKRPQPPSVRRKRMEKSVVAAQRPELGDINDDTEPPTLPMGREFAEPNSSIEPEELGRRFLRDATDPEGTLPAREELEELQAEPATNDFDLLTNSIHEASLFDQPTERGTRSPHVRADESAGADDDAREQAHRNTRAVLSHGRSRAERRPHR